MKILLVLAFRNLARHRRKTFLLGALIAVGMALLFVANAIFESSNRGLERTYVGSLTAEAAIAASSDTAYGLFGSEIPIASDYEVIPALADFRGVRNLLQGTKGIVSWTPLVSVAARIEGPGLSQVGPVFGVDGPGYFKTLSDLRVLRGNPAALAEGGVFLNEAMASKMEATLGRRLRESDSIRLSTYSGGSFRIRTGHFAGVYAYPARSEVLDRIVLVDPTLARSLANYTLGYARGGGAAGEGDRAAPDGGPAASDATNPGSDDIDSLFSDSTDVVSPTAKATSLASVQAALADTTKRDALVLTDEAAWSFVLVRTADSHSVAARRELAEGAAADGLDLRIMDWRSAAGSSAMALLALQAVFYVALGFIAIGAVLVIMNSLVISVLERTAEIGTMRGLGAGRGFVRGLFVAEGMALTVTAGVVGIILGVILCAAIGRTGIPLSNPVLVSLFGGARLSPTISAREIAAHLVLAVSLGGISWIYPVAVALRIEPVTAMSR